MTVFCHNNPADSLHLVTARYAPSLALTTAKGSQATGILERAGVPEGTDHFPPHPTPGPRDPKPPTLCTNRKLLRAHRGVQRALPCLRAQPFRASPFRVSASQHLSASASQRLSVSAPQPPVCHYPTISIPSASRPDLSTQVGGFGNRSGTKHHSCRPVWQRGNRVLKEQYENPS